MTGSERVGLQIKTMRKQCGFTQEKLANDLFMSQSYLRRIEHGQANPSINMLEKIFSYLLAALYPSLNSSSLDVLDLILNRQRKDTMP